MAASTKLTETGDELAAMRAFSSKSAATLAADRSLLDVFSLRLFSAMTWSVRWTPVKRMASLLATRASLKLLARQNLESSDSST
eukprot:3975900-Alexandrium_andersonii.AAC.1